MPLGSPAAHPFLALHASLHRREGPSLQQKVPATRRTAAHSRGLFCASLGARRGLGPRVIVLEREREREKERERENKQTNKHKQNKT